MEQRRWGQAVVGAALAFSPFFASEINRAHGFETFEEVSRDTGATLIWLCGVLVEIAGLVIFYRALHPRR